MLRSLAMSKLIQIRSLLEKASNIPDGKHKAFYKTGVGQYAEHDKFIGVTVPRLRTIAKEFKDLPTQDIQVLIESSINEERLLALFVLVDQYQKANLKLRDEIYNFYMLNLRYVNNWNLVDSSAHLILGRHLFKTDRGILLRLAKSQNMWERRIAMVATWYFIRNNDFEETANLASILLKDTHDLIHKAVGWMLREMGKRNITILRQFLDKNAHNMPRTMLRYSIEKLSDAERQAYLNQRVQPTY